MEPDLDLDEINFTAPEIKQDPKPKTPKKSTNSGVNRSVGRPSRDSKVREVSQELESMLKLANLGLMSRDLHPIFDEDDDEKVVGYASCLSVYVGTNKQMMPVLTNEGKVFCDAAADIIVDSEFLMKILDSGDKMGKYLKLFMALQPLVMTVINNHGRGRINVRDEVSAR